MAQALYDEHPLESYLRESGDRRARVPGAFSDSSDEESEGAIDVTCVDPRRSRSSVFLALEALRQWSSTFRNLFPPPNNDFAERFRYDLISSNLLSSSVASSPLPPVIRTRPSTPDRPLPGELRQDVAERPKQNRQSFSNAFVFVSLAALLSQYRVAAALAMVSSFSLAKSPNGALLRKSYVSQVFNSLESLKAAGIAWDTIVNDTITTLEQEERSPSLSQPSSPSSALRIALHSTLLTTQHQCDNIRPLLAALASPVELSQLAEMYAPSSPVRPSFALQSRASTPRRERVSFSENSIPRPSVTTCTPTYEKRQTWSGAQVPLASVNARTSSVLRKRDRRRSDMSSLLGAQDSPIATATAPSSPSPRTLSLFQVMETEEEEEQPADEIDTSNDNFGTAALFLRRKRRSRGADAFGLSSSRSVPALRDPFHLTPPLPSLSSLSSSRFTSMQTTRHPLSLSALHHALHGALASRRYACAHLLALRFDEDAEDESYWENVRSVIALLTTTLEDATARLNEALDDADRHKTQISQPSPSASPCPTPSVNDFKATSTSSPSHERGQSLSSELLAVPATAIVPLSPLGIQSFAPAPNGMARFAAHVDGMSSALDEAREQLRDCVGILRDGSQVDSSGIDATEQAVFQVYEKLRRELGLALRECERGKVALTDVFETRRRALQPKGEQDEDDEVPPFVHDTTSGSSGDSDDKHDLGPFTPNDGSPVLPSLPSLDSILAANLQTGPSQLGRDVDDATQHLLLTASSSHLPPPGVEKVYESEAIVPSTFARERSKLSREDRIKLMKAKRESLQSRPGVISSSPIVAANEETDVDHRTRAGWGPSTDVVEELKDVIWKVGERRRKMAASVPSHDLDTSQPELEESPTAAVLDSAQLPVLLTVVSGADHRLDAADMTIPSSALPPPRQVDVHSRPRPYDTSLLSS